VFQYGLHLQVGHQAVECPNGTVNWKGIYGEDAFVLRPPVYESQLRERRRLRTCDEDAVRKAAEQYAKVRGGCVQMGGPSPTCFSMISVNNGWRLGRSGGFGLVEPCVRGSAMCRVR
jgi:hypothetical protein